MFNANHILAIAQNINKPHKHTCRIGTNRGYRDSPFCWYIPRFKRIGRTNLNTAERPFHGVISNCPKPAVWYAWMQAEKERISRFRFVQQMIEQTRPRHLRQPAEAQNLSGVRQSALLSADASPKSQLQCPAEPYARRQNAGCHCVDQLREYVSSYLCFRQPRFYFKNQSQLKSYTFCLVVDSDELHIQLK